MISNSVHFLSETFKRIVEGILVFKRYNPDRIYLSPALKNRDKAERKNEICLRFFH
jgi:hypothetical protein